MNGWPAWKQRTLQAKISLVLVCLIGLLFLIMAAAGKAQPSRCTEDMPCWNCHTMGNKICRTDRVTMTVGRLQALLHRGGLYCVIVRRGGDLYLEDCSR